MRRLRFSLTSLLVVVAIVSILLAIQTNYARQRKQAVAYIKRLGGSVTYDRVSVERRNRAKKRRERDAILGHVLDSRLDQNAYVISVDLSKLETLPPINESAGELRHFPNLMTVAFPNLLDPDDYIRAVLRDVGNIGYYVEGPVRDNRSDANTSPDFLRAVD